MIAATIDRVEQHSSDADNERIRQETVASLAAYRDADPQRICCRLDELDREWDVERYLETMAPTFTLIGVALAITKGRKWLVIPAVVQSFFLQHAIQGWCPPIPLLRSLGIRTFREIQQEREGLERLLLEKTREKAADTAEQTESGDISASVEQPASGSSAS
jgi:hypothetical protein